MLPIMLSYWVQSSNWHLLPKHHTYKLSVCTVCTCQELTSHWHISYFPPSHLPDCTSKSPPISFEVSVDSSLHSGLSVRVSVCACCGLQLVDRNPAEKLKAACSVPFIFCRAYRDLNAIIKMHYPFRCWVRWPLRTRYFLVNTGQLT